MVQAEASKAGKSGKRKNEIGGFIVDKIEGPRIRAFVRENGLELDTDVTDETLAVALVNYFRAEVPPQKQVRCDACLAISSEDLAACPFCGDEGELEAAEEAPEAQPSEPVVAEAEAEVLAEEPAKPAEKPAKAQKAAKASKKAAAAAASANGSAALAVVNGNGALAQTSGPASEQDLDAAVKNVKRLVAEPIAKFWELGQALLDINARQLWKLRVKDGKPAFKSWDQFVHHELGISNTYAWNAIECAKKFESAEDIRRLGGVTKAVLVLKAAEPDRKAIEEKAAAGASKRELAADVSESRKKHGSPNKSAQSRAGAKGAAAKAQKHQASKPREERVSVASIMGSKTIKLYKQPESMKDVDWPPPKRATSIADQPFGRLEMANGLVQYFSLLKKDGELVLKIVTRREEA